MHILDLITLRYDVSYIHSFQIFIYFFFQCCRLLIA
uniref:Uncharacterized protein n=1 Tax=Arundo donax TaxID=35708 RepID=A0A0A9BGH2_ARUDO